MPTKNPRLSVVLPPSVAATLAALAAEGGESASGLVRGLLTQAEPALVRMLSLVRAAKAAQGQMQSGVAASLDRVVSDLEDALITSEVRMERAARDLVAVAEALPSRARRSDAQPRAGARAPRPAAGTRSARRAAKTPA